MPLSNGDLTQPFVIALHTTTLVFRATHTPPHAQHTQTTEYH